MTRVKFLQQLATEKKIPYQMEILPFGGTDAAIMQRFGSGAVATISVPVRYVHTPSEIADSKDIQAAIDLLTIFLERCEECKLAF